jgi:hypothetical protein
MEMNCRYVMLTLAVVGAYAWGSCYTFAIAVGTAWTRVPTITVIGMGDDSRLPLVRDAVAFWNRTFAELGSGFRLVWWTLRPICAHLENLGR